MNLLISFLSDLTAGLVGAAILAALVFLSRKVGPELWRRWLDKLRRLIWPLLSLVFFSAALTSAVLRGDTGSLILVLALAALLLVASVLVLMLRLGSVKIRRLEGFIRRHA